MNIKNACKISNEIKLESLTCIHINDISLLDNLELGDPQDDVMMLSHLVAC